MQRLAILAFWAASAFALVMASMKQPYAVPGNPGDKIQHIVAFITLAALAAWAYPRKSLLTIFLGLSLFGGLIELIQMIPQLGRDAELLDWIADTVAIAVTLLIAGGLRRLRAPRAS